MADAQRRAPAAAGPPLVAAFPAVVDLCNADAVGQQLRSAITSGAPAVVADLSRTGFLDCAGVRMLARAHAQAAGLGIELRVAAPSAPVARIFRLTEADRVLRIYPSAAAALTDGQPVMTDPQHSEESLIALAGIMVTEQSLDKTLRQVLEVTCAALPGGDEGGITLPEPEGPHTAIATSAVALEVDSSQYDAEVGGPCLEAYRRQQILRIDATASEQRWPEFAAAAAAHGLGSTLSVPLIVAGDGLGALNIYCRRPHGFTAADERLAASLGSCASLALANARTYWRAARLADRLQQALSTRGIIDQATGILMAQRGCPAEQALHLLAAAAQRHHLTLHEVAADLIQQASTRQPAP